jgi:flagellar basal-body rod protein FlgB
MAVNQLFDGTMQVLDKVLELRSRKLEVISANIANAETPGYSRLRMDFEDALSAAVSDSDAGMRATHPRHLPRGAAGGVEAVEASCYREMDQSGIGDRNNVSLDQEMVDLGENQIRYEAAIRMLTKKFNMVKLVIQERV